VGDYVSLLPISLYGTDVVEVLDYSHAAFKDFRQRTG
jgi:hypothetical protein